MKFEIFILLVLILFSNSSYSAIRIKPWVAVPSTVLSESSKIIPECKKLEFTPKSIEEYVPEFPANAFPKQIQGWAVFDFKIDTAGHTVIEKVVGKSNSIFEKQALKALKKLDFVVPNNWGATCENQVYRIGYAFRLMSECTGNEFPKPIIGVCTVGTMIEIR
jgi:hypothetical protein